MKLSHKTAFHSTAIAVAILVAAYLLSWAFGLTGEICKQPDTSGYQDCGPYNFVLFALWKIVEILNFSSALVTAIATALLAWITWRLVSLGRDQSGITKRQLRAYIFTDQIGMSDGPTPPLSLAPAANGYPHFNVIIKNTGLTPAYRVMHFARLIYTAVNADGSLPPGTLTYPTEAEWETYSPTFIGPSGTTHLGRNLGRVLTQQEIQFMAGAGHALVAYGRIVYLDTFGSKWETDYCFGYAGVYPIPPDVIFTFMKDGNRCD